MKLSLLKKAIGIHWRAGNAVMVTGSPAVGKTDMIRELAAQQSYTVPANDVVSAASPRLSKLYGSTIRGRKVFDIRLLLQDPADVKGIPVYDPGEGKAIYVMSGEFPRAARDLRLLEIELLMVHASLSGELSEPDRIKLGDKFANLERLIESALHDQYGVLFLDELPQADIAVMNACLGLVLDHKAGTYHLPPAVDIVAAGNKRADMTGTNQMPSALVSRFAHIFVDNPTLAVWMPWAETKVEYERETDGKVEKVLVPRVREDITGFLSYKESLLYTFDPKNFKGHADLQGAVYASPRTWVMGSRALDVMDAEGLHPVDDQEFIIEMLGGIIGDAVASEFSAWRLQYRTLPHPNKLLNGEVFDISFLGPADESGNRYPDRSLEFTYTKSVIKCLDEGRTKSDPHALTSRSERFLRWMMDRETEFVCIGLRECLRDRNMTFIMKVNGWKEFARKGNYEGSMLNSAL